MSEEIKNEVVPELRFPEFADGDDWVEATLGSAARFINGRAYKQEEMLEKGKYLLLRVGNFFTNNQWYYSDLELEIDKYCEDGDLLYAWSASFGPRIWRGEKTIYHYHIWKVEPNKTIDKQFLYILLDYETERMKSQSANGFALLHITKGTIEGWNCNFPVSIKEQQKIANCLSSLDELITAENQKLEAFKTHKKGLMQQLFPAEGETVPQLRFAEFGDGGDWEEKTLGKVAEIITGNTPSTSDSSYYGGNRLFVSPADISEGRYITQTKTTLTEEGFEKTRHVKENSVLFVCIGSTIGKIAQNKYECATNQQINSLVPFSCYSSDFLYSFLEFKAKNIADIAGNHAVPIINKTLFSSVLITLPSTEEQQKIADCLSSLDELITAQTEKIATLKMHKKGLMQGLFPSINE